MRRILILLAMLFALFTLNFRSYQQEPISFVDIGQEWDFGKEIRFSGAIQSPTPISEVVLFIHPYGTDTRVINLTLDRGGTISEVFNLSENPLRAFTPVKYWYQVKLETGVENTSPVYSFLYDDNRFDWQLIQSDSFVIAWTVGNIEFGQTVMNAAEDSLAAARAILPVDPPTPLRIYVYPSAPEMQSAITLSALPWAAGHASPDIGLILLSIPDGPDARAEMERQLPHEIMHILEYKIVGTAYTRTPVWLLEGLSSSAELYPNPEYQRVLQNAVDDDNLVPMSILCQDFPRDLSGAILAYAQSNSFVRFLHQEYGSSGMVSLLNQYSDGLGCEAGVQNALGSSLSQIETRWKSEALGHNLQLAAWKQFRPYFFVGLLILIPLALSLIPNRRNQRKQEMRAP